MHPRNPYVQSPDFGKLAELFPALREHLITTRHGATSIDFQNPASQRCLLKALLQEDFGLKLDLPEDRIVPPLPNRLNYILWIQDIIRSNRTSASDTIRGIDIGTGASAIYPLLGCKLDNTWSFVGTEADQKSRTYAQLNVSCNGMEGKITIFEAQYGESIFGPLCHDVNAQFDFAMCNPPFYSSVDDILKSSQAKELAPYGVCTGAENEMVTEGGEESFVAKMVLQSLRYRTRCSWYTSMLGKLASLGSILALLRENKINNYGVTEFIQGKTRRWAIVWGFGEDRLPDELTRISTSNPAVHGLLPPRGTLAHTVPVSLPPMELTQRVVSVLQAIDALEIHLINDDTSDSTPVQGRGEKNPDTIVPHLVVRAARDTWSRSARRAARAKRESALANQTIAADVQDTSPSSSPCLLECRIRVKHSPGEDSASNGIEFRWLKGRDYTAYEAFCGHVHRKVVEQGLASLRS